MTPQERQLVDDLFERLSKVENAPRDPDAVAVIEQGLRRAPNALYALVQTVLLQDEALKRANSRIQELEAANAGQQSQSGGGFLDSMRETLFGQSQPRSSVPNVPPPEVASRPVWNSGQVMQQGQSPGQYDQQYNQQYGQSPYGQPYGASPMGGGGGSFLGTAAAAAAGMVGGSLLLGSIRSMMGGGGHQQSFADSSRLDSGGNQKPWSDQSSSDLARDAGINDINSSGSSGSSGQRAADDGSGSRAGLFDQASNDDMDHDSDVFDDDDGGGDGDSDFA